MQLISPLYKLTALLVCSDQTEDGCRQGTHWKAGPRLHSQSSDARWGVQGRDPVILQRCGSPSVLRPAHSVWGSPVECEPTLWSEEIHLHYWRAQWIVLFYYSYEWSHLLLYHRREIRCVFLLPTGLHLCVPHWDHRVQRRRRGVPENWLWGHCGFCWFTLLPFCVVIIWRCIFSGNNYRCGLVLSKWFWLVYCLRTNTPRKQGGLGPMKIPLVSDTRRTISTDYGVLKEDEGIAFRWELQYDSVNIQCQCCCIFWGATTPFQGPVHHWPQWHPETNNHQRPAGGALCWGDPPSGPGLSVHRQTRRRSVVLAVLCNARALHSSASLAMTCTAQFQRVMILSGLSYLEFSNKTVIKQCSEALWSTQCPRLFFYFLTEDFILRLLKCRGYSIHTQVFNPYIFSFFFSLPSRMETRKWHHQAWRPEKQGVLLQALIKPRPLSAACSRRFHLQIKCPVNYIETCWLVRKLFSIVT